MVPVCRLDLILVRAGEILRKIQHHDHPALWDVLSPQLKLLVLPISPAHKKGTLKYDMVLQIRYYVCMVKEMVKYLWCQRHKMIT